MRLCTSTWALVFTLQLGGIEYSVVSSVEACSSSTSKSDQNSLIKSLKMADSERKVAMITGGTRGIGSGIAECFAKEGFDLVLGFRNNFAAAEKFQKTISKKYDVKVELVSGSIKEEATIEKYFEVN